MDHVFGVFVACLVAAALACAALARLFRLKPPATRALIFSLGTRNSFLVRPIALALAPRWQTATIVVFLSLVELFGIVAYLWVVPRLIPGDRLGSA